MPEPLSILSGVGTAISILVNVSKGIGDLIEFKDNVNRADRTLKEGRHEIDLIEDKLHAWHVLWTVDTHKKFRNSTYEYFWTISGCEQVKKRLRDIKHDVRILESLLEKYSAANGTMRRIKFVMFESSAFEVTVVKLRKLVKDLDTVTRTKFWETINGHRTSIEASIEGRPLELAILKEQSDRLWTTLDILGQYVERDTLMVMSPSQVATDINSPARKPYERSLWTLLRGSNSEWMDSDVEIDFIRDGAARLSLKHHVSNSVERKSPRSLEKDLDETLDQAPISTFYIGHSLRDCFQRISERALTEQADLRTRTYLDRAEAAIDIVEWSLLTWSTPWLKELCICKICCLREQANSEPPGYLRSISLSDSRTNHACLNKDFASRKHLALATVMSSLAIACQIAVVFEHTHGSDAQPRFVAWIEGSLQKMDRKELLTQIQAHTSHSNHWARAVNHCLVQNDKRKDEQNLAPHQFQGYQDAVLSPLEEYRKILMIHRSSKFGSTYQGTLQLMMEQTTSATQEPTLSRSNNQQSSSRSFQRQCSAFGALKQLKAQRLQPSRRNDSTSKMP